MCQYTRTLIILTIIALSPLSLLSRTTRSDLLAPKPVTGPLTINSPGTYKLAYNIQGQIVIAASNVTLQLNNYSITGTTHGIVVNNLAEHIEIENGAIGPITGANGIEIEAGCSDITIRNVHVHESDIGIHATSAGAIITRDTVCLSCTNEGIRFDTCAKCGVMTCGLSGNDTGIRFASSSDSHVQDSAAIGNVTSGIVLDSSNRISCFNDKIMRNGETSTGNSFGIVSNNGSKNLFIECLMDGTTTTSTTEGDIAAGIALIGSENNSSILRCTISNTSTSGAGASTAHGILLQPTLNTPDILASADRGAQVNATAWRCSTSHLICAGNTATSGEISLYKFKRSENSLSRIQDISHGAAIYATAWSQSGSFLASAGDAGPDGADICLLEFSNDELEVIDNAKHGATVRAIAWAPNDTFIASAGDTTSGNEIQLYQVHMGDVTLTLRDSISHGANLHALSWSPKNDFIAVGGEVSGGYEIRLYEFDVGAKTLTLRDSQTHGATVRSVSWSSDGLYLAIGGDTGTGSFDTRIYEVDSGAKTLTLRDSQTHGATVRAVTWASDNLHLATGGDTATSNEIRVYSFANTTKTLTLEHSKSHGATIHATSWTPNGRSVAVGGVLASGATQHMLKGLDSPIDCIVSKNTVFNARGNTRSSSTGISVPDVVNLIVDNVLYGNNIDTQFAG